MTRRPVLLASVGAVLVIAGILLVLRGMTPLAATSAVTVPASVLQGEVPEIGGRAGIGVPYEHGAEAAYAFTVRNDGPIGVTITGVDAGIGELTLLSPYGVFVLPPGESLDGDLEHGAPLTGFALGPGEERIVVVRGTFDHCEYYHERNLEPRDGIDVSYRILGVPGEQRVTFDRDVIVKSPMIVDCDDRTIDRNDDVRGDERDD